jgi:hypothetical protein
LGKDKAKAMSNPFWLCCHDIEMPYWWGMLLILAWVRSFFIPGLPSAGFRSNDSSENFCGF